MLWTINTSTLVNCVPVQNRFWWFYSRVKHYVKSWTDEFLIVNLMCLWHLTRRKFCKWFTFQMFGHCECRTYINVCFVLWFGRINFRSTATVFTFWTYKRQDRENLWRVSWHKPSWDSWIWSKNPNHWVTRFGIKSKRLTNCLSYLGMFWKVFWVTSLSCMLDLYPVQSFPFCNAVCAHMEM